MENMNQRQETQAKLSQMKNDKSYNLKTVKPLVIPFSTLCGFVCNDTLRVVGEKKNVINKRDAMI